MLYKIAFRNVRKSYQDFMIYFLTLMFSVCLFYTFNSFQAQQEMMVLRESQNTIMMTVAIFMMMLSVFVCIILVALILYANRFLIRRRKKEFGLYMLMGMEVKQISHILVYETFLIGLASLVCGLLLGMGLSQVLAVITAQMIEVEIQFHFVFSPLAMGMTVVAFGCMFVLTMLANARIIRKQKLIDLLQADQKKEGQHLHSFVLSICLFILSLLLLGSAYYLATKSIAMFGQFFFFILFLGSLGTVLFFFSLTGFLLRFISTSKRVYYRNLHMFVLRQIHSQINTSFLSMSVVCLMLLLSIGALATGWNLNLGISDMYTVAAPYDLSYVQSGREVTQVNVQQDEIAQSSLLTRYTVGLTMRDLIPHMDEDNQMRYMFNNDAALKAIPYSQYVAFCKQKQTELVTLTQGQYVLFASMGDLQSMMEEVHHQRAPLTIESQTLYPAEHAILFQSATDIFTGDMGILVDDAIIQQYGQFMEQVYNIDVTPETDLRQFQQEFDQALQGTEGWKTVSSLETYDNTVTTALLFVYIGLYLGIVFLMASAVVLALQQLSEADHNLRRYEVLRKIGVSSNMMKHSVYEQIGIYFLIPLVLAAIHTCFGIPAVSGGLGILFGTGNLVSASLLSAGCIILIYGIYFIFTVHSYERILTLK